MVLLSHWEGANGLAADVRYYGEWMREKTWERIGQLYPEYDGETVIAWLWARTVKCPNPACRAQMPLVRSFDLSKKKGKHTWVEPSINSELRKITFTIKRAKKGNSPEGTMGRRGGSCLVCSTPASFDYIRTEGQVGRMNAQLMAIVTEGKKGRNYYSPDETHTTIASSVDPTWKPDIPINYNPRDIRPQLYGLETYADLFTTRQLVALTTLSELLTETRQKIKTDALAAALENNPMSLRNGGIGAVAYSEAVSVYLAFSFDRATDFNNSLARWVPTNEKIMNLFARQAIPMVWDFGEANILQRVVGGWITCVEYVADCIETLNGSASGNGYLADAAKPIHQVGKGLIISTDPPYYDNIAYADLSDFFYIWLRKNLQDIFPEIFGTMVVPKRAELVASPYRFDGNVEKANKHFEDGLEKAFENMKELSADEYPLTVYYAFKQEEYDAGDQTTSSTGWETMLSGLIHAGFSILGTWPLRSEQKHRIISHGTNALASSIVLVCRPRADNAPLTSRREFVNSLRRELPAALREMQSGNIAPVDLAQASIGPGMAVYSRYSQVLEADGSRLTVRAALQLINQVLDEFLAETEGDLDSDSRFAVSWFEQYGFNSGEFGVADVLARAKNTSVDGLVNAGVIEAGAGKVRLLAWEELDPGWDPSSDPSTLLRTGKRPTVWEATHHLIERLNVHGEEGAALLLAKMSPDLAADARQLAYRLYAICERKGWADHARDYNALVISWSSSQERAAVVKQSYQQRGLFE